jgi:hypothetical protein
MELARARVPITIVTRQEPHKNAGELATSRNSET